MALTSFLLVTHYIGISLCIGAATVKIVLLGRCGSDPAFSETFLKVSRPITKLIIIGMIVASLSGVVWFFTGYDLSPTLIAKLIIFAAVWVLGPYIDNAIEPKFKKVAPAPGSAPSADYAAIWKRYMVLDTIAALLFYVIVVVWVMR